MLANHTKAFFDSMAKRVKTVKESWGRERQWECEDRAFSVGETKGVYRLGVYYLDGCTSCTGVEITEDELRFALAQIEKMKGMQ